MNTSILPVLEILSKAKKAWTDGRLKATACLLPTPAPPVVRILAHDEAALYGEQFRALLEGVADVVRNHVVEHSMTDWPFENFWGKPSETKHSKLLGYFIDPGKDHDCGFHLLKELLTTIAPPGEYLPVEECEVRPPESWRIDLLIIRNCGDGKDFAAVIENKLYGAEHRKHQLRGYVERVHKAHPKIPLNRIYAFYLPRTDDPNFDRILWEDKVAVESFTSQDWPNQHPRWIQITFKKHILPWLETVLAEWCSSGMAKEMRENLSHYRNLLKHLLNKHMELDMKTKILEQLEKADTNNSLPTWADVETVKQSAESLQQCFESVLRGKLLMAILQRFPESAWLCLDNDKTGKVTVSTPYDQRFLENVNVCLSANQNVNVCFGAGPYSPPWLGYMRAGGQEGQKAVEDIVFQEAEARQHYDCEDGWYKFRGIKEKYGDKYVENLAPIMIEQLVEMRDTLHERLKARLH